MLKWAQLRARFVACRLTKGVFMAKSKMIKVKSGENKPAILGLYRRVSTDQQREEGYSLDIQEERLRAYAKTMDHVTEVRVYTDDGYSGGSLERPGITRLIDDVEHGEITHVIVMKLDRLSRSQKDTLHLIEDIFIPHNVAFISMQESFNTNTAFGRAVVGILSVFAQLERENIYERTRSGMQKRVEAGFWPGGGGTPIGYDYDEQQGILVPNQDAELVRYVYDQFLDGKSLQGIANDLGLKYEKTAYNILTKKTNAGYIVYNGREYPGKHQPIVSLETYDKAMHMLHVRASKKLSAKSEHLLSGMLVCGVCGAKMRYQKWGEGRCKLVCYSRQKSKPYLVKDPNCDNEYLWASAVEEGVLKSLFAAAKREISEAEKSVQSLSSSDVIQEQLDREKTKLRRLYHLYGESGDDILGDTIQETKGKIQEMEARLADENARTTHDFIVKDTLKRIDDLEQMWEYMNVRERRAVLSDVIDSITITHGSTKIKLRIDPNF